jgi:archaemetzincin
MATRFNKCCLSAFLLAFFAGCNQVHDTGMHLVKKSNPKVTIGLLPYNDFDTSLLTYLKNETIAFYQCDVTVLRSCPLPQAAWYAPRSRYKADSLLNYQLGLQSSASTVAGLTGKDISTTNGSIPDWGVFGLGFCPGKACVISTHRLQKASKTKAQLKERLIKVLLHELGHNFGLPHCAQSPTCLMADAGGTIAQVDRERKWLCDKCKEKIFL